jgi:(5-formylfuran-3-yl)methyl phosphate transaminase
VIARRAEEIAPFIVMEVLERAREMERQGLDVIHLEVGEPDFHVPSAVKEAPCRALEEGATHYTHSLGDLELREAICGHYQDKYGVDIKPEQVVVTSGTSPAMMLAFAALLEEGQEVIISDPGYACYPNFIRFLGGVPSRVPIYEEDGLSIEWRPFERGSPRGQRP